MRRQVSINLRLDEEMHADLKRIAEEEDRPVANLIRRILRVAIEQHRAERPKPDQPEQRP
jgi:hypothetical protein